MKLYDTNSTSVIKKLKNMFFDLAYQNDNEPQFSSQDSRKFTQSWNFQHITSRPSHPKSNGLAERYAQTVKLLMERCKISNSDLYLAVLELPKHQ